MRHCIAVKGRDRPSGRHGLDVVAVAFGVEDEKVVAAGEVGIEDGITGGCSGILLEGVAHDLGPRDSGSAIGGGEVVDPDTHTQLVHADLAQGTRGGEDQGGRSVGRVGAEQDDVLGRRVVHVPGLGEEARPVGSMIRDDDRRAVVLHHRVGVSAAHHRPDGVDEVGETADDDRLGRGDAGRVGHGAHLGEERG